MSKRANLYTGRAGHLAVMAELLLREWNTAIPEVDVGDDVFVVRDSDGDLLRVQVKTAIAKPMKDGLRAVYNLSLTQLQSAITPDITYVFVVRHEERWESFVVIDRATLELEHSLDAIGTERDNRLILHFRFQEGQVFCGDSDFTKYNGNWSPFPFIAH
jgi:hypothetical protein